MPIPVVELSKAWVCSRSLAEIAGSIGYLSLVSGVCCQVEVCGMDRSLVQSSPTDYFVSECDKGTS